MYYRAHRAGDPLYSDQRSWLWDCTPAESDEQGELLDGVSCCTSIDALVRYFAHHVRGAVEDVASVEEMLGCGVDVVLFEGTETAGDGYEMVVRPTAERGRYTWAEAIAAWDADEELEAQYETECQPGFELPE